MVSAQQHYEKAEAYFLGEGVRKNLRKARSHYQLAAKARHPGALYELAWMVLKGEGAKAPEPDEALRLFKKAVRCGSGDAALVLGEQYLRESILGPRRPKLAAKYLLRAFVLGNVRGAQVLADRLGEAGGISLRTFRKLLAKQ